MKHQSQLPGSDDLDFVLRSGDKIPAPWVGFSGVLGLTLALTLMMQARLDALSSALLVLGLTALPMLLIELFVNRVYLRKTSGLAATQTGDVRRCARKMIGFMLTLAGLTFLYWVLPEYRKPNYQPVFDLLLLITPVVLLFAWFYIRWVDRRQIDPEDIYAQIGGCLVGSGRRLNSDELKNHVLSWLIKGFFLPLMLSFLFVNLSNLATHSVSFSSFGKFFVTSLNLIFIIDVTFGAIGYILSLRVLDAHIRVPETMLRGWLLALICYPPFLTTVAENFYNSPRDYNWENWLRGCPVPYVTWGFLILVLYAGYVWATVCFGCRFSNLTHRGIITYGPYRYLKHPAYICKCLAWWMISVPFVCHTSISICLQTTLLLAIKSSIYWGRAKTEERLLGTDPAYIAYSEWMAENGLVAQVFKQSKRILSLLRNRIEKDNLNEAK